LQATLFQLERQVGYNVAASKLQKCSRGILYSKY
jgi:hypothetical protein